MSGTEDEELAVMKDWWQRNGKPLLTGGSLALVVVLGGSSGTGIRPASRKAPRCFISNCWKPH